MEKNKLYSPSENGEIICAAYYPISLLNAKWRPLILFNLFDGSKSYDTLLMNLIGIPERELVKNLEFLEHQNIIVKTFVGNFDKEGVYSMTEKGWSLHHVLAALQNWGQDFVDLYNEECSSVKMAHH